jgi:hypothetical protein
MEILRQLHIINAHHYETSIRVSCVQQYVENILISI